MNSTAQSPQLSERRRGERGSALITVLLVSTLLLTAAGTLILTSGMSASTTADSTSEVQAYYGAEAGLHNALDILHKNATPLTALPANTQLDFRTFVTPNLANNTGDTSSVSRLSRWITYDHKSPGSSTFDMATLPGSTILDGAGYSLSVTDPDNTPVGTVPSRLIVRVTGYGPRGARKQMEMMVRSGAFDFNPPATMTVIGATSGLSLTSSNFSLGASNAKSYTGQDSAGTGKTLPTIAVTNNADKLTAIAADSKNKLLTGVTVVNNSGLPSWLQDANAARAELADLRSTVDDDHYYTSFSGNADGFTFVDGDCNLGGGSGLLVVTGDLNMSGNPSFDGIILVLGNGAVNRNGGGNGDINGAIVIARFDPNSTDPSFLAPSFNTNGGGNSTIAYNSLDVTNAMATLGFKVRGVREY